MSSAICPFCFHVHDFRSQLKCPKTSHEVPEVYISISKNAPPLWLITIGFKQHGKTCFIAALSRVLEATQIWSSGFFSPLDGFTFTTMHQIREQAADGSMPAETGEGPLRPLLFQACDLPGIGSRCLVIYDVPGESFEKFDQIADLAPAMREVQTVWFFVCLKDLEEKHKGRTLQELFSVYRAGMRRLHIDLRGRTMIVVFTKFDQEDEPKRARDYLSSDPISQLMQPQTSHWSEKEAAESGGFPIDEYRGEMREISDVLEHFTRTKVRGGAGFINMARFEGLKLVFTVTSALGQDPGYDREKDKRVLDEKARPSRVLDPCLWAAELQAPVAARRFHLVLEGSQNSNLKGLNPKIVVGGDEPVAEVKKDEKENVQAGDGASSGDKQPGEESTPPATTRLRQLPDGVALWSRLAKFAEVNIYFLGRSEKAAVAGQPPPTEGTEALHPRIIGPLLESLPPHDQVLVLTGCQILDLGDFDQTDWLRRTLIVYCGEPWRPDGPWQILSARNTDDQLDEVVERFLRLS